MRGLLSVLFVLFVSLTLEAQPPPTEGEGDGEEGGYKKPIPVPVPSGSYIAQNHRTCKDVYRVIINKSTDEESEYYDTSWFSLKDDGKLVYKAVWVFDDMRRCYQEKQRDGKTTFWWPIPGSNGWHNSTQWVLRVDKTK